MPLLRRRAVTARLAGSTRARLAGATGAAVVVWLLGVSAASPVTLTRGPYLGRPDDASVAIVWTTDTASSSRVDYAPAGGRQTSVSDASLATRHAVTLTGLAPGTTYEYAVFSDGVQLSSGGSFRAPRVAGDPSLRFGIIGDTDGGVVPSQIAALLSREDLDLVVHTGDVVYPSGQESRYQAQFFGPMAPLLAVAPVLPTLGNHDVMTERGAPYLANFVLPKNDVDGSSRYYALRDGPALFASVDVESSDFGDGSPQYAWLRRTLGGSDATWKFVFLHEPPFCSGASNVVVRLVLSPLLEAEGVDVLFAGHQHLYERTVPIRNFAPEGPGVVYLTEGGGGASLFPFLQQPYSAFVVDRFGYVVGEIDGGTLTLTAHGTDGSPFDSVVLRKAAPPARMQPRTVDPRRRQTRAVADAPRGP